MALFNRTILTNKGKELISKVMAKKIKMIFTKIEATDFIYREQVNLNELTRLESPKQSTLISDVINKSNKVTLQTVFTNENLTSGYSINAIGVYAKEENGTEILFSILIASEPDFIPAKQGNNLTTINYDLIYAISNSEIITITVENNALATAEMVSREREERIAADNLLQIEINTKEPAITKKSGFNLDKTNLTENDSNKLFTAKGALDLFNNLTTAISTTVEAAKTALRADIVKKIDKTSISDSLSSTSQTTVLSSAGAKILEDKKLNITGGTINGNLKVTGSIETNGITKNTRDSSSNWSLMWKNLVKGGFWALEYHNDPTTSGNMRLNIYFNRGDTHGDSTARYLRFPDISARDEYVAYQSWVNTRCPYQVGDIYLTTSATNPAVLWTGTTWQKIEGKFLRATTSGQNAGINGGSDTKTLTVANLPAHSHSGSTNSAGAHSHTQSTHSHTQPAHKHNLHTDYTGNSSLTGRKGFAVEGGASQMGLSSAYIKEAGGEQTGAATPAIQSAGEHTHTVSIGNTGNGTAFDVVPAYMTVHIWKRVS